MNRFLWGLVLASAMATGVLADAADNEAIRQFIMENPEVIVESLDAYNARLAEQDADIQQQAVIAKLTDLHDPATASYINNPDADQTVVEFYDYACQYCRLLSAEMKSISNIGNVRIVYRELPILGDLSVFAARASIVAGQLGKFSDYHYAIMASDGPLEQSVRTWIDTLVATGVITKDEFESRMDSDEVSLQIQKNIELASELKISGTPAMIIGDQLVPGYAAAADITAMLLADEE